MELRKISANLACQLYRSNYFHVHNYHRTLPMRAGRDSEADYNLKIHTTLIIHERKKKFKGSKQAEFPHKQLICPFHPCYLQWHRTQMGTPGKQQYGMCLLEHCFQVQPSPTEAVKTSKSASSVVFILRVKTLLKECFWKTDFINSIAIAWHCQM